MKNIYLLLAASLVLASCGPTQQTSQSEYYEPAPAQAPIQEVSYQSFYDQLSPYGQWINYPGYGYVWMPSAGPDFMPYNTNGNWIYTNAGWTWASNYNWGWAPFHYGRWFYETGYGWMWVPGNEWAPAWVSWRGGGDYYGWAPLGPRVSMDVALNSYNPPMNYWNFVPRQYMGNPGWHNYYVNQNRNVTIINNTTIINNYSGTDRNRYAYAPGPDPNEVRRVSGNNFTAVQIREANTPGERITGNQYAIYHPRVTTSPAARGNTARPTTPAPARYEPLSNVRPSTQYPANNQPANNQPAANPRPAVPNQPGNQPAVNPRPAQNPNGNQPVTNQPINDPRTLPARPAQNPNNQPVNPQPVNPQPAANPRPAPARPTQNFNDNQPITNPRVIPAQPQNPNASFPSNNTRPSAYTKPVQQNQSGKPHNQTPANYEKPAFQNPDSRASRSATQQMPGENRTQVTGGPVTTHNPATAAPVQRSVAPQSIPAERQVERPKAREANGQ